MQRAQLKEIASIAADADGPRDAISRSMDHYSVHRADDECDRKTIVRQC